MGVVWRQMCQSSSSSSSFQKAIFAPRARHISEHVKFNGKHLSFVDTLSLVKRRERERVPFEQAEAIIAVITEVFNNGIKHMNHNLNKISESLMSKAKMEKEIETLKVQIEANKSDILKYCIGSVLSISAIVVAVFRMM